MLLRRITEHVKAQNWTAIGLDFFIVVVGVFVGIQVSNWNDARTDRALEHVYLERLGEDLRKDLATFKHLEGVFEIKARTITELRDQEAAALMARKTPELMRDLEYSTYVALPAAQLATFNELLSSGRLTLIRNVELRDALSRYYTQYELIREILADPKAEYRELFFESMPGEVRLFWRPLGGEENPPDLSAALTAKLRLGLEVLRADPRFEKAANAEVNYAASLIYYMRQFHEEANASLALISTETGRDEP